MIQQDNSETQENEMGNEKQLEIPSVESNTVETPREGVQLSVEVEVHTEPNNDTHSIEYDGQMTPSSRAVWDPLLPTFPGLTPPDPGSSDDENDQNIINWSFQNSKNSYQILGWLRY